MIDPTADKTSAADRELSPEDEVRLASLFADLTDRAQGGECVDIEEICQQHAELAVPLRELWGAAMMVEAVSTSARSEDCADSDRPTATGFDLPQRLGDFELLEEIGRGGMGVVYRAHQISLNREVAVKMILRGEHASDADLQRFRREAQAAARLEHPHIVPVFEVGQHQGQAFFCMKLIRGQTLAQRMQQASIGQREAATLLLEVSQAIEFAHQNGVLHRDLKPSNILIDEDGQPHVTDFGLAKQIKDGVSITRDGAVMGTPMYMAPEQAVGRRGTVGPATDVYGLGTLLYQMLTGQPPFQAASTIDTVLMVLEQEPTPPRLVSPGIDRDLEMIALRCLQKPMDLRYPTPGALADDLQAYLNSEPISARSGKVTEVVARMFRETHHAAVLENWGLLWMWHSLVLLIACSLTNALKLMGFNDRWYYIVLWTLGLGAWATVFWRLRHRMGPVTFVERQIAHIWAASMVGIALLFFIEIQLALPPLTLSWAVGIIAGIVFFVKAGILSGTFYIQSAVLFATAFLMAAWPDYAHFIFGVVSAGCFFFPGLKYHRQARLQLGQA